MSEITLRLLGDLQATADKIDVLEHRRKEASENKERIDANLAAALGDMDEKQQKKHVLDLERRKKELQIKEEKERQQRMKGRVGEVKTSREYQAVLAETSTIKQTIQGQEEGLLQDMEAMEVLNGEIAQVKERIESIEADAAEAKSQYKAAFSETEKEIAERRTEEKSILDQLPPQVVSLYKMIRQRRGGLAVVEANDEACTACFMHIPPQTYIEVQRGSRVIQCPNCHRILIPKRGDQ